MKVVCDRAALVEALALAGSVVPTRTTAPVLGCIAITAADGMLTVAATNAEVGLTIGVPQVDIQKDGTSLVPSDKLTQIVRACEDTTLTLELEKSMLHVHSEDAHFKIFGFDPKEFPGVKEFPEKASNCFNCSAKVLRRLISRNPLRHGSREQSIRDQRRSCREARQAASIRGDRRTTSRGGHR